MLALCSRQLGQGIHRHGNGQAPSFSYIGSLAARVQAG
jgi:hypothetical protein